MFDAQSANLLRQAPEVSGVIPDDLPRILTDIYTEIVVNRLKANDGQLDPQPILRLIEIANAYETISALIEDEPLRRASAFVSGSAYQILAKSTEIYNQTETVPLSRDHIDGRLAASLLFLIAEQYPDSKEAIIGFRIPEENYPVIQSMVCESLRDLVQEKYESIIERANRRGEYLGQGTDLQTRATLKLYETVLQGVELLASMIIDKQRPISVVGQYETPVQFFSAVMRMSTRQHNNNLGIGLITTYPGPAHLASLLISATDSLQNASIMNVISPVLSDAAKWTEWLRYRAQSKPILWPNHRIAIGQNFHEHGLSAVIVLPTGAGKTTIAEFKIAAALAAGKKVVFLAPTNALVEQLKTDLREALPEEIFGANNPFESDFFFSGDDALSPLEVMTPEKCLAFLNFNSDAFSEVGLMVFDECHMLSPSSGSLRRAIDSMLTILTFQKYVPDADFLFLSAMVKNVDEFADWISGLTGKQCIPINMVWKPSRQSRGILIYEKEQLDAATEAATNAQHVADELALAAGGKRSKDVRAAPGRLLKVVPHALFGLIHNWNANSPQDIRIKKIADDGYYLDPKFGSNTSRLVVPGSNGTVIARNMAIASVKCGYKTIVFINTAPSTYTSARELQAKIPIDINYTPHENSLLNAIEVEMGSLSRSMLENMKVAVPHNARLISFERRLAESLFKRADGASVIFATTTLSQGMNLPAQVAILSADQRAMQDDEGDGFVQDNLQAHELLNAAGRAGRAGYLANGLVFLIPRRVLTFTGVTPEEDAKPVLQSIIPEDERCVTITDPLELVLDQIQQGEHPSEDVIYLFHRLLPEIPGSDAAEILLKKSFGRYIAERNDLLQSYEEKIELFKSRIAEVPQQENTPDWLVRLTIQSGMPPNVMKKIYDSISEQLEALPKNIEEWCIWMITFLKANQDAGRYCFGKFLQPLERVSGITIKQAEHYEAALDILNCGIIGWIYGETMEVVDHRLGSTLTGREKVCPKARELATNIVSRQLSYFGSLIFQVSKLVAEEKEIILTNLAVLECLPNALRYGFDKPEKLAFYSIQCKEDTYLTRVGAHNSYSQQFGDIEIDGVDYKEVFNTVKDLMDLL